MYDSFDSVTLDRMRGLSALREPRHRKKREKLYDAIARMPSGHQRDAIRFLTRECRDLYFWFTYVLRRTDGRTNTVLTSKQLGEKAEPMMVETADWVFARCNEVADSPNGHLDLWAREHYKSSIITFALSLMDVACDPEITIGVFSFRSAAAADFITQFKIEMESNAVLKWAFDDVFWQNPSREAPSWSVQAGLIVKRKGNPREATFEGNNFERGAPVGKHYFGRVYDDIVTEDSVIGDAPRRVRKAWELSLALGRIGGWERYAGTRYAFNDTYAEIIKRGAAKPRVYEAETKTEWQEVELIDGRYVPGELRSERKSVFMPLPLLDKKRRSMGSFTYAAQMLLDPRGDSLIGFNIQDLRFYDHVIDRSTVNVYMLVDPAKGGPVKRPTRSDFTAIQVWGAGADRNYYLLDMIHDRLTLSQRTDLIIQMHKYWKPNFLGYEQVGAQTDAQHLREKCQQITYNIAINELTPTLPKPTRIEKMIPVCEAHRIWLPRAMMRPRLSENENVDLIHHFVHVEFANYPALIHDDLLDDMAWLEDQQVPVIFPELSYVPQTDIYRDRDDGFNESGWMAG